MPDCEVSMKNCNAKVIASELRKTANGFDPWPMVRHAVFWFVLGAASIAAMDYGDMWICVGECNASER